MSSSGRPTTSSSGREARRDFVPLDEELQIEVAQIMGRFRRFVENRGGARQRSGADPFVIALAKLRGAVLVTQENPSGNIDKPKIPDVCNALAGVKWINLLGFIQQEGWKFTSPIAPTFLEPRGFKMLGRGAPVGCIPESPDLGSDLGAGMESNLCGATLRNEAARAAAAARPPAGPARSRSVGHPHAPFKAELRRGGCLRASAHSATSGSRASARRPTGGRVRVCTARPAVPPHRW